MTREDRADPGFRLRPRPRLRAASPQDPRPDERDRADGRAARQELSRATHGVFREPDRDVIAILEGTHEGREPSLIPILVGRMLQTPFSFYRGAAALMAHDLSTEPITGHRVMACGDAHAANFGYYASPERRLVFDLNDFDEAFPGPWEWDVKRLAASLWLSGRNNGHSEYQCREATLSAVRAYRTTMRHLYDLSALQRYYFNLDSSMVIDSVRGPGASRTAERLVEDTQRKARRRTSERVLRRLAAAAEDGTFHIVEQPPIVRRPEVYDLDLVKRLFQQYLETVRADISLLLGQYQIVDYALRIVGVGSVGRRAWVFLLWGPSGEAVFLQAKEATKSVLETHGGITDPPPSVTHALDIHGQGRRVVGAQRILQALSDPFLGWVTNVESNDGQTRDYYIRQFRDMKGSFALEELDPPLAREYAAMCGAMLARAHSQSPGSRFITGYLGRSDAFDEAIASWSVRYADQAEADHAALSRAVAAGRLPAEFDV